MAKLSAKHPAAYEYIMLTDPRLWARVLCPRRRYNIVTTNIAESLNSVIKFGRQISLVTLSETVRGMLQRWFYSRHGEAEKKLAKGQLTFCKLYHSITSGEIKTYGSQPH